MNKSETRWVIVGKDGLCSGQWMTSRATQWAYARKRFGLSTQIVSEARLRYFWKCCYGAGDRAVKATITWDTGT